MKGKNTLSVCLVQLSLHWEDQKKNYSRVSSLLEQNPPPKGSIICFPELFSTGYTMRPHLFSERPGRSETQDFLASLAKKYHSYIIGSLIVRLPGQNRPFNSAIVLSPEGKTLCRYDKVHLFPLGRESRAYSPGKSISVFSIKRKDPEMKKKLKEMEKIIGEYEKRKTSLGSKITRLMSFINHN